MSVLTFAKSYDEYVWGRKYRYSEKYFYQLNFKDQLGFLIKKPFLWFYVSLAKRGFYERLNLLSNGFWKSEFNNTHQMNENCKQNYSKIIYSPFYRESKDNALFSEFNYSYLDSIINLIDQHCVDLFIIVPPFEKELFNNVPKYRIEYMDSILKSRSLKLVDFNHYEFGSCLFTKDGTHLNKEGSRRFTDLFKKYVNLE